MRTSSFTLIPATQHGTQSENYDGIATEFSGVPAKAASYYTKCIGLQTISWYMENLVGYITIEATLDDNADSDNYFSIAPVIGDNVNPQTGNHSLNIAGNYTWIRATVTEFTAGNITKVSMSY